MAEATTTAAKKQSWWPLIWGLAALLICPLLPYFEAVIPIQQTLLLLVPVVAVCSIVGWKLGGRVAWPGFSTPRARSLPGVSRAPSRKPVKRGIPRSGGR